MIVAHIFGLPVEETIPQLAPAGIALFMVLRLMRDWTSRCATRLGWLRAHLWRAHPVRQPPG